MSFGLLLQKIWNTNKYKTKILNFYYIPIKIYVLALIVKPTARFLNLKKCVKIKSEKFFEMERFMLKPALKESSI